MLRKTLNLCALLGLILVTVPETRAACGDWKPDPFCPYPYPDHVTRYPLAGDCSRYWECYQGTKYSQDCPEGLEFNAPLEQCDSPEIAKCDPNAPTTENPNPPPTDSDDDDCDTSGPGPICPTDTDDPVFFPYPGDCTKFYECAGGDRYVLECSPGLWWHPELNECDYPGNYCDPNSTGPITRPTVPDVTTAPPPPHDGRCDNGLTSFWSVPGECGKYLECFRGEGEIMDCPRGLYFTEAGQMCVVASQSECCQVWTCA